MRGNLYGVKVHYPVITTIEIDFENAEQTRAITSIQKFVTRYLVWLIKVLTRYNSLATSDYMISDRALHLFW
ncbi:hypothetical protein ANAPH1_00679 [Anaplasma phagocytophilum]|nr:hypothetical protein ANAPH1_00679 [Anaplasma phagocytophilum]